MAGLWGWLTGKPADPTRHWPRFEGEPAAVNLTTFALGTLNFGDPLAAAEFLGRPDEYQTFEKSPGGVLYYHRAGYRLQFFGDRFADLMFLIGTGGEFQRKPGEPSAEPVLSNGVRLTARTRREELERVFGPPTSVEEYEGEGTMLTYQRGRVPMEVELNLDGTLVYWHLWLAGARDE